EADEADALARAYPRALLSEADDPSRDQAGDLHDAKLPRGRVDDDAVAFVVLTRLVEIRVEEEARMINNPLDAALDRRPVHVNVEHRHEDRHALKRPHAETELRRRRSEAGEADDPVRRRDDQIGADRSHPGGVAKEIRAPQRRKQAEPSERR